MTKEQRLRRLVEDVLVGLGFDEAYTWSLAADDPTGSAQALRSVVRRAGGAADDLRRRARRGGRAELGHRPPTRSRCSRSRASTGRAASSCPRSGGASPGSPRAASCARRAPSRRSPHGARGASARRAPEPGPLLHPGKAARTPAGAVGEFHPAFLDGEWGVFELDLGTLAAGRPERVDYRGRDHLPGRLAGRRVRRPRGSSRPARSSRRCGRPAARSSVRCVFSTSTAASRWARDRSPSRSRLAFQSPERTLSDEDAAKLRERIVAALAERFGAELRA